MFLSSEDLDKENQEIKGLKAKLEYKENLRREPFISQATMDHCDEILHWKILPSLLGERKN